VALALIAAGADLDKARTDTGGTPLYGGCFNGHLEVALALIAGGAEVDKARTDDGGTPLYVACSRGQLEVVLALIAAGADVNSARTDSGLTPLMSTTFGDTTSLEVAQLLVCHGADLTAEYNASRTAAAIARSEGHPEIADWLAAVSDHTAYQVCARVRDHARMRQLLRAGGADPAAAAGGTAPATQLALAATDRPVCPATAALAAAAARPWSPLRHLLHPPATRSAIGVLLHVAAALRSWQARSAWNFRGAVLPREAWLEIFEYLPRGSWPEFGRAALEGGP
jgi:ankyrin repeat protein